MVPMGSRSKGRAMCENFDTIQDLESVHEEEKLSRNSKSTTKERSITLNENEVDMVANQIIYNLA